MHCRRLTGTVFHVVGVGDNQLGAFFHHIVNQLRNGDSGTICRIDLVNINHLAARHHFFDILGAIIMGLAPAMVVIGPDKKQPEDIGFFRCQYRSICH